jgi:hypothetical protein
MFSCHNLVLFPFCNKILLDSYLHMLCSYSCFLVSWYGFGTKHALVFILVKKSCSLRCFHPHDIPDARSWSFFLFFRSRLFLLPTHFLCSTYIFIFNVFLPYWLLEVSLFTLDVFFPHSFMVFVVFTFGCSSPLLAFGAHNVYYLCSFSLFIPSVLGVCSWCSSSLFTPNALGAPSVCL